MKISRLLWLLAYFAFVAAGAMLLFNAVSGIGTGNIGAVTPKGSGKPPVVINRKESPEMFWGNVVLQSFGGFCLGAVGIYGCLKKKF